MILLKKTEALSMFFSVSVSNDFRIGIVLLYYPRGKTSILLWTQFPVAYLSVLLYNQQNSLFVRKEVFF